MRVPPGIMSSYKYHQSTRSGKYLLLKIKIVKCGSRQFVQGVKLFGTMSNTSLPLPLTLLRSFGVTDDLTHAWDAHRLRLPLSTFERLPRDVVLFRVLDRVQVSKLFAHLGSDHDLSDLTDLTAVDHVVPHLSLSEVWARSA